MAIKVRSFLILAYFYSTRYAGYKLDLQAGGIIRRFLKRTVGHVGSHWTTGYLHTWYTRSEGQWKTLFVMEGCEAHLKWLRKSI